MKERRAPQPVVARCKLVLVGDVQCGKTAMLQVLAKDCYPEVSGPPAGQLFSLPARLPVARFPPAGGEGDLATPPPSLPHATLPHPQQPGWRTALPQPPLRPVPLLPPRWLLLTSSPIGPDQIPSSLPLSRGLLSGEGTGGI